MKLKSGFLSTLAANLLLGTTTAAFAHGAYPTLPLGKASAALPYHHIISALSLSKVNPSLFRIKGLSGASSAFLNRNKAIVNGGFNSGFNSAINSKLFQGQITNGQLIGTFYESINGNSNFNTFPHYVLGFGNNPLNQMDSPPNGTIAPSTLISNITFTGGGSSLTPLIHGMAVHGLPGYHLSGSGRAEQSQINALANGANAAGLKFGNAQINSPIVGGQFFGTDYASFGGLSYHRNRTFDYSFGTDSLNTGGSFGAPITFNTSTFRNYIQLANGKVFTYSSGLIPASGYFAGGGLDANWIFALGKNQYNFFSNFAGAPGNIMFSKLPAAFLNF